MRSVDRRGFCLGLGALSTGLIFPSRLQAQSTAETTASSSVEPIKDTMTQAQRDARMAWWRAARFGLFIHWGLYAELAGYWHGQPEKGRLLPYWCWRRSRRDTLACNPRRRQVCGPHF